MICALGHFVTQSVQFVDANFPPEFSSLSETPDPPLAEPAGPGRSQVVALVCIPVSFLQYGGGVTVKTRRKKNSYTNGFSFG